MSRALVFAPQAVEDLAAVFDYIAADNPQRALTYVEEIRRACRVLCEAPFLGVHRPDLRDGVRLMSLRRRVAVVYVVLPETIRVLRVFTAGQDYETIFTTE